MNATPMQIATYIHEGVRSLRSGSLGVAGKKCVIAALEAGLPPHKPIRTECRRTTIYLDAVLSSRLRGEAARYGLTVAELFSALAYALVCVSKPATTKRGSDAAESHTDRMRETLRDALIQGIRAKRIVLAEGSTGLGKTQLLIEAASAAPNTVLYCAPTLSTLAHGIHTWLQSEAASTRSSSVALGRGQFVDLTALQALIAAPETRPPPEEHGRVLDWINNEGRLPGTEASTSENSAALRALMSPFDAWLVDDIVAIAPSLTSVPALSDLSDPASRSALCYQGLRDRAAAETPPDIVFATHAMLARDAFSRYVFDHSLLPARDVLLVDEAHMLEEVFANSVGTNLSIFTLQQTLKTHEADFRRHRRLSQMRQLLHRLEAYRQFIKDCPKQTLELRGRRHEISTEKYSERSLQLLVDLESELTNYSDLRGSLFTQLDYLRLALRLQLQGRFPIQVSLSPHRHFPTFHLGPSSVRRIIESMWGHYAAAGLVSATLFVDSPGRDGYGYMRARLALPPARTNTVSPQIAPWLKSSATLHLPTQDEAFAYIRPRVKEEAPEEHAQYCQAVAEALRRIHESAVGGTLVLFTGYGVLTDIARELAPHVSTLIVQEQFTPLSAFEARFRREPKSLWLGTGSAWTGLNLVDHRRDILAVDDILLTDVVIVGLPFRTATTTAAARQSHNFASQVIETALRLKQGIGRLVRREGLRHRRLHILDGRISSNESLHRYTTSASRRVLNGYQTRPLV